MATIAARLREIRGTQSQRAFAQRLRDDGGLDVTHTSVGNYEGEGGTEKIPAEYVAAVCKATGYPPAYVLGLSDVARPPAPTAAQWAITQIADVMREMDRRASVVASPPNGTSSPVSDEELDGVRDAAHATGAVHPKKRRRKRA